MYMICIMIYHTSPHHDAIACKENSIVLFSRGVQEVYPSAGGTPLIDHPAGVVKESSRAAGASGRPKTYM